MYPWCNPWAATLLFAMSEQSYVVRIYRKEILMEPGRPNGSGRRRHDRIALTGVVEMVERGERLAFHDIEELWTVLVGTAGENL